MTVLDPVAELDPRFSSPDAPPTPWTEAQQRLEQAEVYWLATVRPDGRPHVTTLVAVWLDGALYFCTGADERKARNLARSAHCVITTGCNTFTEGLDVVVEGDALQVRDDETLQRVAGRYDAKYGPSFHFEVRNDAFWNEVGGEALLYEVRQVKVLGFGKGETFSQTRWRF